MFFKDFFYFLKNLVSLNYFVKNSLKKWKTKKNLRSLKKRKKFSKHLTERKAARESKPYGDELKQAISYAFKAVGNLNGEVDSIGDDEDEGVVNVESDHKTLHEDADTHTVSPSSTQMNNDSDWENFLPENQVTKKIFWEELSVKNFLSFSND